MNNKVKLEDLNMTLNSFKVKYKQVFMHSTKPDCTPEILCARYSYLLPEEWYFINMSCEKRNLFYVPCT